MEVLMGGLQPLEIPFSPSASLAMDFFADRIVAEVGASHLCDRRRAGAEGVLLLRVGGHHIRFSARAHGTAAVPHASRCAHQAPSPPTPLEIVRLRGLGRWHLIRSSEASDVRVEVGTERDREPNTVVLERGVQGRRRSQKDAKSTSSNASATVAVPGSDAAVVGDVAEASASGSGDSASSVCPAP